MRTRRLLAGCVLVIGALLVARIALGRSTASPILSSLDLSTSPGSVVIDQHTGRAFVVNQSLSGAGFTGTYAFASAASYSFAVNGAGVGSLYNPSPASSLGSVGVLGADGRFQARDLAVPADPGVAAIDSTRGLLYVTHSDENLISVLDVHRMALIRTVGVGSRPTSPAVSEPTGRVFVVNGGDGTVSMLDSTGARTLRTVPVPAAGDGAGVAVDSRTDRVFVAGLGLLSVLDARDGTLLKTVGLGSSAAGTSGAAAQTGLGDVQPTSVAVDESAARCYILVHGLLTVVDAGNARVLRRIRLDPDANALAVAPRSGDLLLTRTGAAGRSGIPGDAGSAIVLDPRTGNILHSYSLGLAPAAMAIDERTGRVVIVGSKTPAHASDPWGWLPASLRRRLPFAPKRVGSAQAQLGRVLVLDISRFDAGAHSP